MRVASFLLSVSLAVSAMSAQAAEAVVADATSAATELYARYPYPLEPGHVLMPATGERDPNRPVVRLLISPFAFPNVHFDLIVRTNKALSKLFGPGNFEVVVSNGDPEDLVKADLALCSAGTYLHF